jgi:hypothetical protein
MFAAVPVIVPDVKVGIVPTVIVAAVDVVVPNVPLGLSAVAIVPFVISALVLIDLFPVTVPRLRTPVKLALVYVPPVSASSNKFKTVVCLGATPDERLASSIMILSSVATAVSEVWSLIKD